MLLPVSTVAEADEILAEVYPSSTEVVLQQRLDLQEYEEWTVDLLVTDGEITVDNTRHTPAFGWQLGWQSHNTGLFPY